MGEPDFDTPEFIKQYAWEGLEKGLTKYTATAGTADFRSAIVEFYATQFGADISVDEVSAADVTGPKLLSRYSLAAELPVSVDVEVVVSAWLTAGAVAVATLTVISDTSLEGRFSTCVL